MNYWKTAIRSARRAASVAAVLCLPAVAAATSMPDLRVATFNASLNRNAQGQLVDDLSVPPVPNTIGFGANGDQAKRIQQARNISEIIQRVNPDVLLINEFDFVAGGQAVSLYNQNFLQVGQNGAAAINFPHTFVAPSNTGIASGFDLNNNGAVVTTPGAAGYGDDALGFGNFPGQFGMAFFSKFPIITSEVRTFQNFKWKDMPGALLPDDAGTAAPNDFYSAAELDVLPLSSKSHWDVPIQVGDEVIHVLMAHPTPPVFDGPEDRNGRRNHDEIRFWADYVAGENYIYDDNLVFGGLEEGAKFVILGDYNADPFDGDSVAGAINQFLENPIINNGQTPSSLGAAEASLLQGQRNLSHRGASRFDTADFADFGTNPGNLRVDYVLPSANLGILNSGVFWPQQLDSLFPIVGNFSSQQPNGFASSDHRLVFVDLTAIPEPANLILLGLAGVSFLGRRGSRRLA